VAEEIGLGSSGGGAVQAGRLFLERIDGAIAARESVLVESTLSGLGMTRLLRRAAAVGYGTTVGFVFVQSAELCIARIRARVQKGGHFVPDDDVRRRFHRALVNFWTRYRLDADRWQLAYNGGRELVRVAFGVRERAVILDLALFERFQRLLEEP
jgi:predicted ABC-type ATPase